MGDAGRLGLGICFQVYQKNRRLQVSSEILDLGLERDDYRVTSKTLSEPEVLQNWTVEYSGHSERDEFSEARIDADIVTY